MKWRSEDVTAKIIKNFTVFMNLKTIFFSSLFLLIIFTRFPFVWYFSFISFSTHSRRQSLLLPAQNNYRNIFILLFTTLWFLVYCFQLALIIFMTNMTHSFLSYSLKACGTLNFILFSSSFACRSKGVKQEERKKSVRSTAALRMSN